MQSPVGGKTKTPRKTNGQAKLDDEHLPPNLAKPVKVRVPDFSNPKRPKTCLEVDFPLVPINALSALEGNAGKPIYQMSKWWARRRSCVFRAMLIAAAMEAPIRKNPDGSPVLDDQGQPIPDETEAAKAVWDVYYANHQAAENFKHLKVLDCFMGGGTTLVEGSRLGFQVVGRGPQPRGVVRRQERIGLHRSRGGQEVSSTRSRPRSSRSSSRSTSLIAPAGTRASGMNWPARTIRLTIGRCRPTLIR